MGLFDSGNNRGKNVQQGKQGFQPVIHKAKAPTVNTPPVVGKGNTSKNNGSNDAFNAAAAAFQKNTPKGTVKKSIEDIKYDDFKNFYPDRPPLTHSNLQDIVDIRRYRANLPALNLKEYSYNNGGFDKKSHEFKRADRTATAYLKGYPMSVVIKDNEGNRRSVSFSDSKKAIAFAQYCILYSE